MFSFMALELDDLVFDVFLKIVGYLDVADVVYLRQVRTALACAFWDSIT